MCAGSRAEKFRIFKLSQWLWSVFYYTVQHFLPLLPYDVGLSRHPPGAEWEANTGCCED